LGYISALSDMHRSTRIQTALPGIDTVSIRSDRTFPRHSHDEFGLGYIAQGGQSCWSGCGLVDAQAGDTITVNPAEMHDGLGRNGQSRQWHMIFVAPEALARLLDGHARPLEFTRPVSSSPSALTKIQQAFASLQPNGFDQHATEQRLMLALDTQITGHSTATRSAPAPRSRAIETVLDMIHQSWEAPLSLDDFARATGTSRFQILRRFAREVGTTPHGYLTQHRVKRAKDLIVRGTPLAEAALACGFSDQSHLNRVFSKQYGVTPGGFAKHTTH